MPIAFGSSGDRIVRSGFVHGMSCVSIINRSEPGMHLPGISPEIRGVPGKKEEEESLSSCSSSIGRNSDCSIRSSVSDGQDSPGETEVQSSYKGPLDSLDALEESLPIRRGISNFYCGKSKSYASLSEATSPKDLAKPESPYNRKRRNLIASSNIFYDKNRNDPLRYTAGGISKRPANLSRRTLALAVAMNSFESNISEEDRLLSPLNLLSGKSSRGLLSSRSFSLADLQVTGIGSNKKFC